MSAAQRYELIEAGELSRLRQKQLRDYNPTLKSMANAQDEIARLLNDSVMSAEEKLARLTAASERFNKMKVELTPKPLVAVPAVTTSTQPPARAATPPTPQPPARPPSPPSPTPQPVQPSKGVAVAEPKYADSGTKPAPLVKRSSTPELREFDHGDIDSLRQFIQAHPKVLSHSRKGLLKYRNTNVSKSNYDKLLESAVSGTNLKQPGFNQLIAGLKELHLPPNLPLHPKVRKLVESQSGEGHPPGKRPRILWLYR